MFLHLHQILYLALAHHFRKSSESQHKDMDFFKKTQVRNMNPLCFLWSWWFSFYKNIPKRIIPVISFKKNNGTNLTTPSLPTAGQDSSTTNHQPPNPSLPPGAPTPEARLRSVPWRKDGRDEPSKCPPFGGDRGFRNGGSSRDGLGIGGENSNTGFGGWTNPTHLKNRSQTPGFGLKIKNVWGANT